MPKITSNLWAQWESEPLFNSDARLSVRLDAQIKSSMRIDANTMRRCRFRVGPISSKSPSTLILNGRIALSDSRWVRSIPRFALWGRNLTDDKHIQFRAALVPAYSASASFQQARTFGADLTVKF